MPWRGVFRLIGRSSTFVFYDDVQFDKHGWRNRNRIQENGKLGWITVPVNGSTSRRLDEVTIDWSGPWAGKLLKRLAQTYAKRPYRDAVLDLLEQHLAPQPSLLVDLTIPLTECIAELLFSQSPQFVRSSALGIIGSQSERLALIAENANADTYLSGPSAKDYLDESAFVNRSINVSWENYSFPEDSEGLDPAASILDYLALHWSDAKRFILS